MQAATEGGAARRVAAVISIPAAYAGCDGANARGLRHQPISIPAAYAGCDEDNLIRFLDMLEFQSPQPMQAATTGGMVPAPAAGISIPAAYAGCDDELSAGFNFSGVFQSPQPMQAAT